MPTEERRKLFSRGEWLTLLGMALAVMSSALVWGQDPPPVMDMVGKIFVSRHNYTRAGYDIKLGWLPVGWTVVICAVTSGCLLLYEPSGGERRLFFGVQLVLGLAILALALLHIGFYPGIILAILGGSALV